MIKKPGYKHTQLGWIPEEWEVSKILDSCLKVMDGTHFSPKSKSYGDYMYLTSKNIRNEGIDLRKVEYVTQDEHKVIYQRCPVMFGDILLTKDGANVGNCCVNTIYEEFSLLSSVAVLRSDENKLNNYFLIQFLKGQKGQSIIQDEVGGQAITRITLEKIRQFPVPLPPVSEQRRIASTLFTWDTAIAKQQQLIDTLQTRHRALMQQLLTGKKRLKGFKGEWKEVKLGKVFERVVRRNDEGNNTVVTISAQRGFVLQTDFFNKNIASELTNNYFLVEKGEFCYNKSYSNGYPWGAIKRLTQFEKAVVTTLYICFGVRRDVKSFAPFFEFYFEAGLMDKGIMKIAHEGGRAHGLLNVTPNDFFNLLITIPESEEQIAIAEVLRTSDKEIQTHRLRLAALQEQKKGLMQVLLTGKVRVKV